MSTDQHDAPETYLHKVAAAPPAQDAPEAEPTPVETVPSQVIAAEPERDEEEPADAEPADEAPAMAAESVLDEEPEPDEVAAVQHQEPAGILLDDAGELMAQWKRAVTGFVDDPPGAVTAAAGVLSDAAAQIEAALRDRQQRLRSSWDGTGSADTETLRQAMLNYRQLLDQLLA